MYKEDGDSVSSENCNVKASRSGDGFEVLTSTRSKVSQSYKNFNVLQRLKK